MECFNKLVLPKLIHLHTKSNCEGKKMQFDNLITLYNIYIMQ